MCVKKQKRRRNPARALFVRVAVRRRRVLVAVFTVLVGGRRVVLGLVVLALRVVMGRLKVMMSSGVVVSGRLVMMLVGRMFLRHLCVPL